MQYFRETVTWKHSGSLGSDLPEAALRMHTVYIKTDTKLFFCCFVLFFKLSAFICEASSGLNNLGCMHEQQKLFPVNSTHDEYVPKLMGRLLFVCSSLLFLQTNARLM